VELGEEGSKLAMVSWGSTYGAVNEAVRRARAQGKDVSHVHLRYMWPMPRNLEAMLKTFDKVIVPELNNGQLVQVLRSEFLIPAQSLPKVAGKPFRVAEVLHAIDDALEGKESN
jgi:2-oxoglutarate ferredoxin oxidoreductase subunit alpha